MLGRRWFEVEICVDCNDGERDLPSRNTKLKD